MTPRFSIIVPTTGRPTLERALDSLARQVMSYDEVLVSGEGPALMARLYPYGFRHGFRYIACPTGGHFGCEERTAAIQMATGTHLLFLDDDDAYVPGALAQIRTVVAAHPRRPIMARMIARDGMVLWREKKVTLGNQGSPQFIVPNDPAKLGRWTERYVGDFDFLVSTLAHYPKRALVWDETVLCACRQWADRVWEMEPCAS